MTATYAGVRLDPVEDAVAAIARGEAVVVVDDEDRENEGDLIFAAQQATPELVGLHDPAHLRLRLRAHGGAGPRPARAAADDRGQRGPQGHRLRRHASTPAT